MNTNELIAPEEQVFSSYEYYDKKLWNPNSLVVLSLFFSFLPAAILYSLNFGRQGFTKKKNIILISSIALFVVLAAIAIWTNSSKVMKSLFLAINVTLGLYMGKDQKIMFENHISRGGKKASYLIPIIICLIVCALLFSLMIYTINIPDNSIIINGDELYYTEEMQMDEVNRLGNYLAEEGLLASDGRDIAVKIDKSSDKYIFSMIVGKENINDEQTNIMAKAAAEEISTNVFNNSPVEVNLCDGKFAPLKVVTSY